MRTSSSWTARTISAERGISTATQAWPSTSRRPPTPTSSSRTPTGRDSSPPARRSSSTPTMWPTSTTCASTCDSTPASTAPAGTTETKAWCIALAGGETLTARYLITATGFLSQPKTPDIPGITGFAGKVIHTTDWDDSYDLEGKRVAIIGTGATAVQLIPELAKKAADLTVYQRTPIWVVPKLDFGFSESREATLRTSAVGAASHPCDHRRALRVLHFRRAPPGQRLLPSAQCRGGRPVQDTPHYLRSGSRSA